MKKTIKAALSFSALDTLKTVLILSLSTLFCYMVSRYVTTDDAYSYMIFILSVFLVARFTKGYFYGSFSSLCCAMLVNYLFAKPYYSFNFTSGSALTMLCFFAVAIVTCTITTRALNKEQVRIDIEREKTKSNLLRAVSHDLRTPLTSILGACSVVIENDDALQKEERIKLLSEAKEDAQWLIRMVENLLSITRIDGGNEAKITKQPEVAEEIIETAVAAFKKRFPNAVVYVKVPEQLLLVPMDSMLITQVIINLLENVQLHAKTATETLLAVADKRNFVEFSVTDNGVGLKDNVLEGIFTATFKPGEESESSDAKRSMGIGLSVCNTIVMAHGGLMKAENVLGGGARFIFTLPKEATQIEQ